MQTNEIISEIIAKINTSDGAGIRFQAVNAFEFRPTVLPIKRVFIAISTNNNKVTFFDDENEECCRKTTVRIKMDFISPPTYAISETYSLAETILDELLVQYAGRVVKYDIGKAKVDNDLKALRLPCYIDFVYEQCPAYGAGGENILPLADFLCRSHVNNDTVHVTSAQKQYIMQPFVTGTYIGDDEESRDITLGFEPKFAVVFGSGTACYGSVGGENRSYIAFAIKNRSTKGLQITQSGLRINNLPNVIENNVKPCLNSSQQTYNYFVMR